MLYLKGHALEALIKHTNDNQCAITKVLGLSRGTTRKKLKKYGFIN